MTTYRPSPKSKASTLIQRLSHATAGPTNEVLVKRLEQDARRLMAVDVVGAHTVLGGTASLRWDADAVHDHYRIALQHRTSAETLYNYSIALENIEETQAAFDAATKALKHVPDDKFLVDHAVGVALQAGRFSEGHRLCERWHALVPGQAHSLARRMRQLADAAAQGRFSEDAVRRLLAVMKTVQQRERIRGVAERDDGGSSRLRHVPARAARPCPAARRRSTQRRLRSADRLPAGADGGSGIHVRGDVRRHGHLMPVTPHDIHGSAVALGEGDHEVDWRNAGSRAYFAAFHRCRRLAMQLEPNVDVSRSDAHQVVRTSCIRKEGSRGSSRTC